MNLCIKKVEGIPEPVKMISMSNFAVGERTNKVYAWCMDFEQQS